MVDGAIERGELPACMDPASWSSLVLGAALMRVMLLGEDVDPASAAGIAARVEAAPTD